MDADPSDSESAGKEGDGAWIWGLGFRVRVGRFGLCLRKQAARFQHDSGVYRAMRIRGCVCGDLRAIMRRVFSSLLGPTHAVLQSPEPLSCPALACPALPCPAALAYPALKRKSAVAWVQA